MCHWIPKNLSPLTVIKVIIYAREVNITTCKIGIFQLPVSFLETATVERHWSAKIKNTIKPTDVATVNSFSPDDSTFAVLSELSNVF